MYTVEPRMQNTVYLLKLLKIDQGVNEEFVIIFITKYNIIYTCYMYYISLNLHSNLD